MNFLHRRGAAGKVHEPEAAGNAKPHGASEEDQDAQVKPHAASEDTKDARINQMRAGDADASDTADDDYADGTFVCAGFFCLLIGGGLVGLMIFCYLKHRDPVWERMEEVDRREGLGLLAEGEKQNQKKKKSRNSAIEEAFYLMRASEGAGRRPRGEGSGAEEEEVLEFENGGSSRTSSRPSDRNTSSFANSAQPQNKLAGGLNMTMSDSDDAGRAGSKASSAASQQVQGSSSSSGEEDSDS
eukprot:g3342.t1